MRDGYEEVHQRLIELRPDKLDAANLPNYTPRLNSRMP